MVNNNYSVDLPKIVEVRYLNNEIPSYEEFLKNYKVDERVKASYESEMNAYAELGKGCGPCPDLWNESDAGHTFDNGFQAVAASTKGRIEGGANERIYAGAGIDVSGFRFNDGLGDLKIGTYSVSAEAGIGPDGASAKYKLGVDVASLKVGGVKGNVGFDVGSEASIGEGSAKLKVGGVGVSIGKEIGFSTPFGGVSINLEETAEKCAIQ